MYYLYFYLPEEHFLCDLLHITFWCEEIGKLVSLHIDPLPSIKIFVVTVLQSRQKS